MNSNEVNHANVCLWCGNDFKMSSNKLKKFCSPECSFYHRTWRHVTSLGRSWSKRALSSKTRRSREAKYLQKRAVRSIYALTASESVVYDQLVKDDWKVFKNGWPDFFAVKDGKFKLVEVKMPGESLRPEQEVMHALLKRFLGLEVEVVVPNEIKITEAALDVWDTILQDVEKAVT